MDILSIPSLAAEKVPMIKNKQATKYSIRVLCDLIGCRLMHVFSSEQMVRQELFLGGGDSKRSFGGSVCLLYKLIENETGRLQSYGDSDHPKSIVKRYLIVSDDS